MVESEAQELSEDVMLGAVTFGHESFQPVIQAIIELAEHAAKEPWPLPEPSAEEQALKARVDALARAGLAEAYREPDKGARHDKVDAVRAQMVEALTAEGLDAGEGAGRCSTTWKPTSSATPSSTPACASTAATPSTVRPIIAEVGVLPRAHGSALFTRGETQAFCVATLGTGQDEQIIDALEGEYREHFMLHYNFPPYSVGEAGRMGSPGPARGRPRQAGLAGDPSAAAGEGQVPLHAARRLRDHRKQRLVPRWRRCAAARSR